MTKIEYKGKACRSINDARRDPTARGLLKIAKAGFWKRIAIAGRPVDKAVETPNQKRPT